MFSRQLLSPNQITVWVVLWLGLWFLLGCDKKMYRRKSHISVQYETLFVLFQGIILWGGGPSLKLQEYLF